MAAEIAQRNKRGEIGETSVAAEAKRRNHAYRLALFLAAMAMALKRSDKSSSR